MSRSPGIAAAVLAIALASCTAAQQAVPTATPLPKAPTPVPPTYRVEVGPVVKRIDFSARAQPRDTAELYFETDGRVLNVAFREGDSVRQSDVLAELDVADLRNELEQRQVELRTAQSVLSNTLQNYTRTLTLAQLDVEQARLRLAIASEQAEGAGARLAQNDLDRNARQIEAINASIQKARDEFNQAGADNAARLLEDAQLERARLQVAYDRAVAEQRAKQLETQLLQKDVERAELNYQTILSNVDPNLVNAVERARLAVEGVEKRLGRSQLVAPFDGTIAQQRVRAGSEVRALDPVITMARPGELEVVGTLTPLQASDVDIGQTVSCYFENAPNDVHEGVVREFPRMLPTATNQLVRLQLPPEVELEAARLARCSTILGQEESVMWLPPQAIRTFQGRRFVVLQDPDGRQRRVDVVVGLQAQDRVEVKSGVAVGDVIVAP